MNTPVLRRAAPDIYISQTNYNFVCFGDSSASKFDAIDSLLRPLRKRDGQFLYIGETHPVGDAIVCRGGAYCNLTVDAPVSINPFNVFTGDKEWEEILVQVVMAFLPSDLQTPQTEHLVVRTFERIRQGAPDSGCLGMAHIYAALSEIIAEQFPHTPSAQVVLDCLAPFAIGEWSQWFNGKPSQNLCATSSQWIDTTGLLNGPLPYGAVILSLYTLAAQAYYYSARNYKPKVMLITCTHAPLQASSYNKAMQPVFRKCRSHDAAIGVLDIPNDGNNQIDFIVENCAWHLYGHSRELWYGTQKYASI
jgi:hypothetical protein